MPSQTHRCAPVASPNWLPPTHRPRHSAMRRMTDPAGRCFVSYRRHRAAEARLLVQALHDVGVPTWQDIENLDAEPTEDELGQVLADPSTASALVWITPEVTDSPVI